MKRRLDLALALVHGPRVLFLDEPTTGLDLQSRAALWDEVAAPRRRGRVTVFLTTQYLEEADQLADRIGIIDDGKIVAEGTPASLEGGDRQAEPGGDAERSGRGRPRPRRPRRFGERVPAGRDASVRLEEGAEALTDVVRALDAEGLRVADFELHAPTLDDVFLEKTGRHLEGAGDGETPTGEHPLEGAAAEQPNEASLAFRGGKREDLR